ncbi:MAG: phosphatidylserine decarboxylase [Lachnospiraceae bacterium]|nr:phosphatidylserine decarboxylase [Lachnospiraceae bacterium]
MTPVQFLYHTNTGRALLPFLTDRRLSRLCGSFLDSPASAFLIPGFVKRAGIDLSEFETENMKSFNDCFSRKIRDGLRPVCEDPDALIAPCDGLAKAFPIREDTVLHVKECSYTVSSLLGNAHLAARFEGGVCLVFRLCVNHYHRYCYIESGRASRNVFLPGVLHTVRPDALDVFPVFAQNCRSYTLIRTRTAGTVLQMEVGAMLVGRIRNHYEERDVVRGLEKGYFQYGGSTVIVLLQKGKGPSLERYLEAGRTGTEIPVLMGQRL